MPVCVKGVSGSGVSASWVKTVALGAAAAVRREKSDLAVVFVKGPKIRALNRYRGKNTSTDILSFPAETKADLGDIFICPPAARKKAAERGVVYRDYLRLLIVHGVLHLAGHDHRTAQEAANMERMEKKILKI